MATGSGMGELEAKFHLPVVHRMRKQQGSLQMTRCLSNLALLIVLWAPLCNEGRLICLFVLIIYIGNLLRCQAEAYFNGKANKEPFVIS